MAYSYDEETHSVWIDDYGVMACGLLDKTACLNMARESDEIGASLEDAAGDTGLQIDITKTIIPLWIWGVMAALAALWAFDRKGA
jgi:hypothetical protein